MVELRAPRASQESSLELPGLLLARELRQKLATKDLTAYQAASNALAVSTSEFREARR